MTSFMPRSVAVALLAGSLSIGIPAMAAAPANLGPTPAPEIGQYAYDAFLHNVRTVVTARCVETGYWTPAATTLECEPSSQYQPAPGRGAPVQRRIGQSSGEQTGNLPGGAPKPVGAQASGPMHAAGPQQSQASLARGKASQQSFAPSASGTQSPAAPGEREKRAATGGAKAVAPGMAGVPAAQSSMAAGQASAGPPSEGAQTALSPAPASAAPPLHAGQHNAGSQSKDAEMGQTVAGAGPVTRFATHSGTTEQPAGTGGGTEPGRLPTTAAGALGPAQGKAGAPSAARAEVPQAQREGSEMAQVTAAASAAQLPSAGGPAAAQPAAAQATPAQPSADGGGERTPVVLPVTVTVDTTPLFGFDRAALGRDSQSKLDDLLAKLKDVPYGQIAAVGFADPIGTISYNLGLSKARAESVEDYLERKGVPAGKIHIEGRGETQAYASLSNCGGLRREPMIECLQPDRRVEVTVLPAAQ